MTPATATIDAEVDAVVAACEWCGERLSSPYLRRPDGVGFHVACAKDYARTAAGEVVAGTGVDPVTSRFSGARSAN